MTSDDVEAATVIADVLRDPHSYGLSACNLCGGIPVLTGIFWPTQSFARRIGQPRGKTRIVAYAVCSACKELPDLTDRVEQQLIADLGVQ